MKPESFILGLFIIFLVSLFTGTIRTINVEALGEYNPSWNTDKLNHDIPDEVAGSIWAANSELISKLDNTFQKKFSAINDEAVGQDAAVNESKIIIKTEQPVEIVKAVETDHIKIIIQNDETTDTETTNEVERSIKIAKIPKTSPVEIKPKDKKIDLKSTEIKTKIDDTIKIAADTSASTIIIGGEETLIPGSSEKNITYMQILQKPNDLELNLKYAQQQGKIGNYKQTISTLERLNMLYPDNIEIKLYLLSILVQADSPNKALTIIAEIKTSEDLTSEDLETVNEIETTLKERGKAKMWNFYADISLGGVFNQNVNSVSKTRTQISSDSVIGFNTAKYDKTYSEALGLTATRSLGEASSFMINMNVTDSDQEEERTDDYENYGLTLALDTSLGNQNLSPYLMLNKTDYQDDADSFSLMYGAGGYFSAGDLNSFSYGYSFSDSKNNRNSSDTTANATNAIGHAITLGHDFMFNELTSSSTGLGYSISEAKDGTNDYETYDLNFRLNFAFPWAYISIGDALSFNDYKHVDTSINSGKIRSDVTNTFDLMLTKAIGDIFPSIDRNKSLFINLSYEKVISEANIINYDYIADSFSLSFSKSIHLNK